jgi:hypothetical protein
MPDEQDDHVVYLGVDDVIALHAEILGCTEAEAADQLRSRDGLEGAVARPFWHAYYNAADLGHAQ